MSAWRISLGLRNYMIFRNYKEFQAFNDAVSLKILPVKNWCESVENTDSESQVRDVLQDLAQAKSADVEQYVNWT